jgi:molybdenum cofactor cytidylyltransferase
MERLLDERAAYGRRMTSTSDPRREAVVRMVHEEVVGVLLGAGSSRRLGRPKQTLPLGDTTVLGWTLCDAENSALDRVCVVLGGAADEAARAIRPARATVVYNAAYGSGCASSLLAGLDYAGECAAIMMLLGDMPGVDATVIDGVLAAWRADPSWAAVTAYDDGLGHPFVFSAVAFPALRDLHGDKAVWKLVDAEPEGRVRRVRVSGLRPLDVDTWDDYLAACRRLGVEPRADVLPAAGPTG